MVLFGDLDMVELDELRRAGRRSQTTWARTDAGGARRLAARPRRGRGRPPGVRRLPARRRLRAGPGPVGHRGARPARRRRLAGLRLGLLHGQMPAADKEAAMAAFRAGEIDVLVATTVIEVGVDVAEATVMVIEDADRFGIAQLHQLRGRVGRSRGRAGATSSAPAPPPTRPSGSRLWSGRPTASSSPRSTSSSAARARSSGRARRAGATSSWPSSDATPTCCRRPRSSPRTSPRTTPCSTTTRCWPTRSSSSWTPKRRRSSSRADRENIPRRPTGSSDGGPVGGTVVTCA